MEYLAETGELFLDPGIVSYTKTKPENDYEDNAIITSMDSSISALDGNNDSSIGEETTKSWSVWLSSMMNKSSLNINDIPDSVEKKYTERRERQSNYTSSKSLSFSSAQQESTVLAKRVSKTCRNGDLYIGLVDAVTGKSWSY